jgi:hypothetical protein
MTGAGNDWQKDQQFRKLNAQRDAFKVKVVRGGSQVGGWGLWCEVGGHRAVGRESSYFSGGWMAYSMADKALMQAIDVQNLFDWFSCVSIG